MLLTIYNLPSSTRYSDIKSLILSKCGFKEVILDNLSHHENNTKKVTVGLAEEEDAAILMRKISGLFVDGGHQLYVETVKKKQDSSIITSTGISKRPQPLLQQPYYQQTANQTSYQAGYTDTPQNSLSSLVATPISYGMFVGPSVNQNAYANYGYPPQGSFQSTTQLMPQSINNFDQEAPLGFNNQSSNSSPWSNQQVWNPTGYLSGGNQNSQQSSNNSRWNTPEDSNSRSTRDAPSVDLRQISSRYERDAPSRDARRDTSSRDYGRDAPSRDYRRDAPSRDYGRDAPSRDYGRDTSARDRGRDGPSRYGRDERNEPPRDRRGNGSDRDGRGNGSDRDRRGNGSDRDRGRDAPKRDYGQVSPTRDYRRVAFRRNELPDAPSNESTKMSSYPNKPSNRSMNPSPQVSKFSQQRDGFKSFQPSYKPEQKPFPSKNRTWVNQNAATIPPAKRPRETAACNTQSNEPAAKISKQTKTKKKNKPINPDMLPTRSLTWRCQIASTIAKDMIANLEPKDEVDPKVLLTELKRAIRNRLELMFGENFIITMPEMEAKYRLKYNTARDSALMDKVVEEIKKNPPLVADGTDTAGDPAADKKPLDGQQNKVKTAAAQGAAPGVKKPAAGPPKKQDPPGAKKFFPQKKFEGTNIPSYPMGDKRQSKLDKKENELIFQDEEVLLNKLSERDHKQLNEEVEELCKLILEEFEGEEPKPESKEFHQRATTYVIDELKKALKINIAKRLLNTSPILLRIFHIPKTISRGKLGPILEQYGIASLRKSLRKNALHFGSCDSYEVHDKVCTMEPIVVDGSTIVIKPFQLTGQKEKMTRAAIKKHRKNLQLSSRNKDDELFNDSEGDDDDDVDEDENIHEEHEDHADQENYDGQDIATEGADIQIKDETVSNTELHDDKNIILESNDSQESGNLHESNKNDDTVKPDSIKTDGEVTKQNKKLGEVENVNSSASAYNTEQTDKLNKNIKDTLPAEDIDFTEDVFAQTDGTDSNQNAFKIGTDGSEHTDTGIDKELKDIKPEDLEDFGVRKNYDDIDIADVNEDDLEDW